MFLFLLGLELQRFVVVVIVDGVVVVVVVVVVVIFVAVVFLLLSKFSFPRILLIQKESYLLIWHLKRTIPTCPTC